MGPYLKDKIISLISNTQQLNVPVNKIEWLLHKYSVWRWNIHIRVDKKKNEINNKEREKTVYHEKNDDDKYFVR